MSQVKDIVIAGIVIVFIPSIQISSLRSLISRAVVEIDGGLIELARSWVDGSTLVSVEGVLVSPGPGSVLVEAVLLHHVAGT